MYLHVDLRQRAHFMLVRGAASHGVGHVEKSIVASIMTQKQVNGCQRLKIAMMQPAVRTIWVLKKRNTVAAAIQVIAGKDGLNGVT